MLLNFKSKKKPTPDGAKPAGHLDSGQVPCLVGQPGGDSYGVNSCYQFYRLATRGFHEKAEPVGYVIQSQKEPIRIKQGSKF